jgi:hypothetical protein
MFAVVVVDVVVDDDDDLNSNWTMRYVHVTTIERWREGVKKDLKGKGGVFEAIAPAGK